MTSYNRQHLAALPCTVAGCPEPRAVYRAGYIRSVCARHQAERKRRWYWASRGQSVPAHEYQAGRPGRPRKHPKEKS